MKNIIWCRLFFLLLSLTLLVTNANELKLVTENEVEDIFEISELKSYFESDDENVQISGLSYARKLLTDATADHDNSTFDEFIKNGIPSILIDFLQSKNSTIQMGSAWILTHISMLSPHRTKAVVEAGAIPIFVDLIDSSNSILSEEATLALGAFIERGQSNRDDSIKAGIIPKLHKILDHHQMSLEHFQHISGVIKVLCVHSEIKDNELKQLLPLIKKFFILPDSEVINNLLCSIQFILKSENENKIQLILDSGLLETVLPYLKHKNSKFRGIALCIIGRLGFGTTEQKQMLLDNGVLNYLNNLLYSSDDKIRGDTLTFLSYVSQGPESQINAIFEDSNLIRRILYLFEHDEIYTFNIYASKIISNAARFPKSAQALIQMNAISQLIHFLYENQYQLEDHECIIILEILNSLIKNSGNEMGKVFLQYTNSDGLSLIEDLQEYGSSEIKNLADQINESFNNFYSNALTSPKKEIKDEIVEAGSICEKNEIACTKESIVNKYLI